jgi:rhodanese-related sulfurtransferase
MSPKAAGQAVKMGFTNVKVMLQGAPGWKKAGQMMVADHKFVAEGNIVLVDLRAPEEVAAGHIARAVNIPLAKLAEAADEFPASKAAPIVLYGNGDEAKKGAKIVKEFGFKTIAQLDGGLAGWQAAGHQLVKGTAGSEIKWVRILGADEVSIADFEKAVAGKASGQMILDVRGKDEVIGGIFPGAVNIPLDELESRLAELPKDQVILTHCSTGARAELAVAVLKKNGLKARFLLAEVACEDGECEVSE